MSENKSILLAPDILETSVAILNKRGQQRDKPNGERSMEDVIKCFNIMRKKDLKTSDGWLIMELVKQVRSCHGEFDIDHYFDGAAYCALRGEEMQKEKANANN